MSTSHPIILEQLVERRQKLESAMVSLEDHHQLAHLIDEIDDALLKVENDTYGLCEICHEPVESSRIIADPLCRFCLAHLSRTEQRALEQDLELASRMQQALLPENNVQCSGWHFCYHYEPLGVVSGDYCDLICSGDGDLYFLLGDVSGKGVAASMSMSQLHAMFRTLISFKLPVPEMVARASRIFCESALPTSYATLVCGRARMDGDVEICNAGHLPALLMREGTQECTSLVEATGLPLGMFSNEKFGCANLRLDPGDSLLLYTDGLSEATSSDGEEYGRDRVHSVAHEHRANCPKALVHACIESLTTFQKGNCKSDDLSLMFLRRL